MQSILIHGIIKITLRFFRRDHLKDGCIVKRKWTAALLALVLLLALPLTAAAETFATDDFSVEIPEGSTIFEPSTSVDDPSWALAGLPDPQKQLETLRDMHGVALLVLEDGTNVLIQKNESDTSQRVFNLKDLSQEERDSFLDGLMQARTDEITIDKYYIDINGQPFYRVRVDGAADNIQYHEVFYGTIVNGYSLMFDIYGGDNTVTEEQEELLLNMSKSVVFSEILPKPESTVTPETVITTLVLLVLLVLVILVPVVYLPLKNRRDKRLKAKLAEQLTEYHKTHSDNDAIKGEMRFVNSTDCTKEAIHTFSLYQCYIKNVGSLVVGGLLCLCAVVVAFIADADWWIKLLTAAIVVYYGYKVFSMPHTMEKAQRRVFDRCVSSTAHYAFYDDVFRVSGIQSTSVYPYFQITDVRKHGHYLYLYYGPENAYMVDQYGFSLGEWEDFQKFIAEKTAKEK